MIGLIKNYLIRFFYSPNRIGGLFTFLLFFLLFSCADKSYKNYEASLPEKVDFNFHIRPILSDRCFACHGPDKNAVKANLRLDIAEGALKKVLADGSHAFVSGSASKSEAYQRMISDNPQLKMPPPEANLAMTDYEIAMIAKWIDQGAEYKPHWSFVEIKMPTIPQVESDNWVRNPIDNFVLKKLEDKNLQPNKEADKETLLRRVSLDLTGLPPSIKAIDDFVLDESEHAYEKVVDRLLASSHYGERMALEWLDVARYADSHGYSTDGSRTMWPWRDWLIDAFNNNMPYDRFVTWQVAGDKFPDATKEQRLATAFLRNQKLNAEGGIVLDEYLMEYAADRTETVATAFLGLTMQCAKCHDHKYDQISQKEYFEFFSFFNNVNEGGMTPNDGNSGPQVLLTSNEIDKLFVYMNMQIDSLQQKLSPLKNSIAESQYSHLKLDLNKDLLVNFTFDDTTVKGIKDDSNPTKIYGKNGDFELVEGKKGKGLKFTGFEWLNLKDPQLNFDRSDLFSFSFWVNANHESTYMPILLNLGRKNDSWKGYEITVINGYPTIRFIHDLPAEMISVRAEEPIEKGSWVHYVFTYNGSGSANGIKIYKNGKESKKHILSDQLTRTFARKKGVLQIGGRQNYQVEVVGSGIMDDLKIYKRVLSGIEVRSLFNTTDFKLEDFSEEELKNHYLITNSTEHKQLIGEMQALRKKKNKILDTVRTVMVMQDLENVRPTYILDRGAYDMPLEQVYPSTPTAVFHFADDLEKDRMGLAKWLVNKKNPLTARVAINRYWQLIFGLGIVKTVEDFGNQGALPHHPELLDYLAASFMQSGWNVKQMMKSIVMSSTYRQASRTSEEQRKADPENSLLARGSSHRLQAEFIRDLALKASGLMVADVGGESVKPYQTPGLWEEINGNSIMLETYVQDVGDDLYRRSMYTFWRRASPPPTMTVFDAPSRDFCSVKRSETNTPLQALALLNDPQFVEAARVLAEKVIHDKNEIGDQIKLSYRLLTGLTPGIAEVKLLEKLYEEQKKYFSQNIEQANNLLAVGNSKIKYPNLISEVSAMTVVCNTIMSFDETIMKR